MNHYLQQNHSISIMSVIHQCAEESVHKREDNCHNIIMYLYQIIVELLMQWLISKVLYRQSLHTNLLSFLIVSLYQYKTLTLKLY